MADEKGTPHSEHLHVFNDGEVAVDMVLECEGEMRPGKNVKLSFGATGRLDPRVKHVSREQFLAELPVPADPLKQIRDRVGGFEGQEGETKLNDFIQQMLRLHREDAAARASGTEHDANSSMATDDLLMGKEMFGRLDMTHGALSAYINFMKSFVEETKDVLVEKKPGPCAWAFLLKPDSICPMVFRFGFPESLYLMADKVEAEAVGAVSHHADSQDADGREMLGSLLWMRNGKGEWVYCQRFTRQGEKISWGKVEEIRKDYVFFLPS